MELDHPLPDWNAKTLRTRFLDSHRQTVSAATLNAVAYMLFEIDRPEHLMEIALTHLGTTLRVGRVDVGLGSPSKRYHVAAVEYRELDCPAISMVGLKLPNTNRVVQRVWHSHKPVAYEDIDRNPFIGGLQDNFADAGIQAMLAQRLENEGSRFGIVCVDELEYGRSWTEKEHGFLFSFCREFFGPILDISRRINARHQPSRPSAAELEAIRLAARGLSYKEVARLLKKSVRTVETQFRNARLKTGAANQAELVRVCEPWL